MENVVTLIVGISWPVAAIWISYIFREELRGLLSRVSHLKYKELEASFESTLAEAEKDAGAVQVVAPSSIPPPESFSNVEQLHRISEISPRAAIMESWVLIESAASKAGFASGATIMRLNPHVVIEHLAQSGKLPNSSIELIRKLHKLRNQAAHMPDFTISQEEAQRYLELAVKSAEIIRGANIEVVVATK